MDEENFNKEFRDTSFKRAGWEGWLRNNLVTAGNRKDDTLFSVIVRLMRENPSPMVRRHAAWAACQLDHPAKRAVLETALQAESNESVRNTITALLVME